MDPINCSDDSGGQCSSTHESNGVEVKNDPELTRALHESLLVHTKDGNVNRSSKDSSDGALIPCANC
jgi:hypothetical protein